MLQYIVFMFKRHQVWVVYHDTHDVGDDIQQSTLLHVKIAVRFISNSLILHTLNHRDGRTVKIHRSKVKTNTLPSYFFSKSSVSQSSFNFLSQLNTRFHSTHTKHFEDKTRMEHFPGQAFTHKASFEPRIKKFSKPTPVPLTHFYSTIPTLPLSHTFSLKPLQKGLCYFLSIKQLKGFVKPM
jgi:hypothetical protein